MNAATVPDRPLSLEALLALSSDARAEAVGAIDDREEALIGWGDDVEALVVAEVSRAIDVGEALRQVAAALGGGRSRSRIARAVAQACAYAGDFDRALELCDEAIELANDAGDLVLAARARLASLHSLGERGRYEEAVRAGEAARVALLKAGRPDLAARADLNLGVIRRKAGDPEAAAVCFERARHHLRDQPMILAQLESNLGEAYLDLDRLDDAHEAFSGALRVFMESGFAMGIAIVEGNLGDLATRRGNVEQALAHFERARRHIERDSSPTHHARILIELGETKLLLGMPAAALDDLSGAIPTLEAEHMPRELARAFENRARALTQLGRVDEATDAIRMALDLHRTLRQPVMAARLSVLHSELHARSGRWDDARDAAEFALAALDDRPLDGAMAQTRLAQIALHDGELDEARRLIEAAREAAEQFNVSPLLADVLHVQAQLERAVGKNETADALLKSAIELLERTRTMLGADRFRAAFLGSRLAVYEARVRTLIDLNRIEEAFEVAEAAKGRSLLDAMVGDGSAKRAGESSGPLAKEMDRVRSEINRRYARLDNADTGDATDAGLEALELQLSQVQSRIDAIESPRAGTAARVELADIQAKLPKGRALVEFAEAEGELCVFVVTATTCRCRLLGSMPKIEDRVRRFRFQVGRALRSAGLRTPRASRLAADARAAAAQLYESLFTPVDEWLEQCDELVVVAHGVLHAIPFVALNDGAHDLIERFRIVQPPSAGVYARLCSEAAPVPEQQAEMVVIGVSDSLAPSLADEASWLLENHPNAMGLLEDDATVDRVRKALTGAQSVHLATHGRFVVGSPDVSGLRLADRWLTAREVSDLSLDRASVVVSGCDTGLSEARAGDELAGLARAFFMAGASSLTVSVWPVHDEIGRRLMVDMYEHRRAGLSQAEALRRAQLATRGDVTHPAAWAPFICMGSF